VDEPPETRFSCGGQYIGRSGDIAVVEASAVECVDNAGDVDDRVGSGAKSAETGWVFQRSRNPLDTNPGILFAAGECANLMSGFDRAVQQARADEAGGAGNREL
jgi:hypothetical protein